MKVKKKTSLIMKRCFSIIMCIIVTATSISLDGISVQAAEQTQPVEESLELQELEDGPEAIWEEVDDSEDENELNDLSENAYYQNDNFSWEEGYEISEDNIAEGIFDAEDIRIEEDPASEDADLTEEELDSDVDDLLEEDAILEEALEVEETSYEKENSYEEKLLAGNNEHGLTAPSTSNDVTTWDCIYFGTYPQEDTNWDSLYTKEDATPIKWRVLSIDGDDAFILADQIIDGMSFGPSPNGSEFSDWSNSSIRSWLNGYASDKNLAGNDYSTDGFLLEYFRESDRDAILQTTLDNSFQEMVVPSTKDKIFLLSVDEVRNTDYGFIETSYTDMARCAGVNFYSDKQAYKPNSFYDEKYSNFRDWYLRSPSEQMEGCPCYVSYDGSVDDYNGMNPFYALGVRPALHVDLSKADWYYAGTVQSDGTENSLDYKKIYFYTSEGTALEPYKFVVEGQKYKYLADGVREGYDFLGWYTDTDESGVKVTSDSDIDVSEYMHRYLYAKWEPIEYTITFDPCGGSVWPKSEVRSYDSMYGELPEPSFLSAVFIGWYTAETGGTKIRDTSIVKGDITLYAHWAFVRNLIFDPNGGTVEINQKKVVENEFYGELPVPTRDGYEFLGWYRKLTDTNRIGYYDIVHLDSVNVTVYAKWAKLVKVTFDANGGTVYDPVKYIRADGTYAGNIPYAYHVNQKFAGWYTEKDGGVQINGLSNLVSDEPHTLYAHWTLGIGYPRKGYSGEQIDDNLNRMTYDCVYFGSYKQKNQNEKEPIKWRVLKVDGNDALLWPDSILDATYYMGHNMELTADMSPFPDESLYRSWLNSYDASRNIEKIDYSGPDSGFYNQAFNEDEKRALLKFPREEYSNYEVPWNISSVPAKTSFVIEDDYVGLLSKEEMIIIEKNLYQADPTTYAIKKSLAYPELEQDDIFVLSWVSPLGVTSIGEQFYPFTGADCGSLMYHQHLLNGEYSSIRTANCTIINTDKGTLYRYFRDIGVYAMPAVHLDLSSDQWYNAGTVTVTSQGKTYDEIKIVKATFDPQNGQHPTTKVVYVDDCYGFFPQEPTKSGYAFAGWYTAPVGGEKVEPSTYVRNTNNHTLYAHWDKVCTLTFHPMGGQVSPPSIDVIQNRAFGILPIPTKEHYVFNGWYLDLNHLDNEINSETIVNSDHDFTIYATWEAGGYLVTYDANGGACRNQTKRVVYEQPYGELTTAGREGYIFKGWFTERDAGTEVTADTIVSLAADQILYAHWEEIILPRNYTVTFDACEGLASKTSMQVTEGEKYGPLATAEKEGYLFKGWFTEKEAGTEVTANTVVTLTADQTLYAHWEEIIIPPNKYMVTFDACEGVASKTSMQVTEGEKYGPLATAEKEGYLFKGWFTEKEAGTEVTANTVVTLTADQTLYAHWEEIIIPPNKYTVTFDACEGLASKTSMQVTEGEKYGPLATAEKEGFLFKGWFTEKEAGTEVTADTVVTLTADQTLYAHWEEIIIPPILPKKYTITFDACGGSLSQNTIIVTEGEKYGAMPDSAKERFLFGGWYTAKDGGKQITPEMDVDLTADITLYAHWDYLHMTTKQKMDVKKYFSNVENIKKYLIEKVDGTAKPKKVSNKGIIKIAKIGVYSITPLIKVGKKYEKPDGVEPLVIVVTKPVFKFTQDITNVPSTIDATKFISDLPLGMPIEWYIAPSKADKAIVDANTGLIQGYKKGSVKVTCIVGEPGYTAKYSTTLRIKIPKLKETTTINPNKTKTISLQNVSKYTDVSWQLVDTAQAGFTMEPTTKKNAVKITAPESGTAELIATVDGVKYKCTIICP